METSSSIPPTTAKIAPTPRNTETEINRNKQTKTDTNTHKQTQTDTHHNVRLAFGDLQENPKLK
jgi:hypothetical protein